MIERTVVLWDASLAAHTALRWAAARAESRGEQLAVVRVPTTIPVPGGMPSTTEIESDRIPLDTLLDILRDRYPLLRFAGTRLGTDALTELIGATDRSVLFVLGVDSRWRGRDLLHPAITSLLAAPVAIVPVDCRGGSSRVVAFSDGTGSSDAALEFAAREADRTGESLDVAFGSGTRAKCDREQLLAPIGERYPGVFVHASDAGSTAIGDRAARARIFVMNPASFDLSVSMDPEWMTGSGCVVVVVPPSEAAVSVRGRRVGTQQPGSDAEVPAC